jgi:hypothetical protein
MKNPNTIYVISLFELPYTAPNKPPFCLQRAVLLADSRILGAVFAGRVSLVGLLHQKYHQIHKT